MFRWIALASAVVCILALTGAILSSQQSIMPGDQIAEQKSEQTSAPKENKITLFDRWFPDSTTVFNLFLMIFTGILAFGGLYQLRLLTRAEIIAANTAQSAKVSAEAAKSALIAANRPWVKVEIQVGGPIIYNENGANFALKFILTNIGHSPATNAFVYPRLIFPIPSTTHPEIFNPRNELQKDIANLKTRPPPPFGYAVFPGDKIEQPITVSMSKEDIERATETIKAIYPQVVGAVDYRMGLDDKPHQTGFIVEIRRDAAPRVDTIAKNRWPAAIWIDEGDVPADQVRLFRSFIDGGYAD